MHDLCLLCFQEGFQVRVIEAAPSLRQEGTAIGLWDNAWKALDILGVSGGLRPHYSASDK
jgi:2-polyprenyl-6-methoxyphenol hydroxylase-like FAD-dependent oxidoreductase